MFERKLYVHLIFILCLCFSNTLVAQKEIIKNTAFQFTIPSEKGKIDFIVVDSNLHETKPILLFCQGSMPVPLIFKYPNDKLWLYGGGLSNINYKEYLNKFRFVVVSKPGVPLVVPKDSLDENFCYVAKNNDGDSEFPTTYLLNDNKESYTTRAVKVLDYVLAQPWSSKDSLFVFGHSEGATIGLNIAKNRNDIKALGLSGFNPMGRIDQSIREVKLQLHKGEIDDSTAHEKILEIHDYIHDMNDPSLLKKYPDFKSWQSFSELLIQDLVALDCPIYIMYGGKDIVADLCDLLPIYFLDNGKTNFTLKRYPLLDHNYFLVSDAKHENGQWTDVFSNFIDWLLRKK